MLGRALFTVVGLIIAAGLVLPFYPQTAQAPSATSVPEVATLWAAPDPVGCPDCPVEGTGPNSCRPDCGCGERLMAAFVMAADQPVRLILAVTVRVLPGETSSLAKLPAI
jgi:hypothetical protein